jgi:hypothetical protein
MKNKVTLNGREVDPSSIEIENVDRTDFPKFCSACIGQAVWMNDGTALNDEELEQLTDEQGELVNELAHKSLF